MNNKIPILLGIGAYLLYTKTARASNSPTIVSQTPQDAGVVTPVTQKVVEVSTVDTYQPEFTPTTPPYTEGVTQTIMPTTQIIAVLPTITQPSVIVPIKDPVVQPVIVQPQVVVIEPSIVQNVTTPTTSVTTDAVVEPLHVDTMTEAVAYATVPHSSTITSEEFKIGTSPETVVVDLPRTASYTGPYTVLQDNNIHTFVVNDSTKYIYVGDKPNFVGFCRDTQGVVHEICFNTLFDTYNNAGFESYFEYVAKMVLYYLSKLTTEQIKSIINAGQYVDTWQKVNITTSN